MRRREFITLLSGAIAWPLAARAQQPERVRRIGVLSSGGADDTELRDRLAAFVPALQQLGWSNGRNLHIEIREGGGNPLNIRKHATELVELAPDAILTSGTSSPAALIQATRTIPIVFVIVPDPVGSGFVETLARPGGNVTGFMQYEYSLSGKWLELLKQIAPNVTRAAILRDADVVSGIGQFAVIQSVAPSLGLEVSAINMRDRQEIERRVSAFARAGNGGLVIASSALAAAHRDLIVGLAERHQLPAVYYRRYFAAGGGLISYGVDYKDQYLRAAGYIDRILKGQKPADLPVQAPTKYELVINLKTAKTLGLPVPAILLARADEVIE